MKNLLLLCVFSLSLVTPAFSDYDANWSPTDPAEESSGVVLHSECNTRMPMAIGEVQMWFENSGPQWGGDIAAVYTETTNVMTAMMLVAGTGTHPYETQILEAIADARDAAASANNVLFVKLGSAQDDYTRGRNQVGLAQEDYATSSWSACLGHLTTAESLFTAGGWDQQQAGWDLSDADIALEDAWSFVYQY